uniref:Uncharacterized protein n=1 Tax=Arundo donax TaxID=35708 RepID=A0A0A9H0F9_ARUDO
MTFLLLSRCLASAFILLLSAMSTPANKGCLRFSSNFLSGNLEEPAGATFELEDLNESPKYLGFS